MAAGVNPAPARKPGEGLGPFHTLIIHGATLIDGTGAPPGWAPDPSETAACNIGSTFSCKLE